MTTVFSGDTGADTVGPNTVGSSQVIDASIPLAKLSVTLPFTKEYVSPQQAITSGGQIILTHGLGSTPKLLSIECICLTAQAGWVAGDIIDITSDQTTQATSAGRGITIQKTPTQLVLQYLNNTSVFQGATKGTGATFALTNTSWEMRVRAWA